MACRSDKDGDMNTRRHDIDALRVFAFSLLILYHVGMFYVADWGWHVKSAYTAEWLQLPMGFTNQWRMSLLFVISGLALSLVIHRYTPGQLAGRRTWRLLVPLIFGMAFIVAPQPYYEALSKGLIEPGFLQFMGQYLTFQDFPGDAWGGEEIITWTWNHLWYLPYLLFYTLVLLLALALGGKAIERLQRWFQARSIWQVVLFPLVPLIVYGLFVFPHFSYISHALIDDWYAHAMYGTFFFLGFLIGRGEDVWAGLAHRRWLLLGLGVMAFAALLGVRQLAPETGNAATELARSFVIYLNRWTWILVCLAWGHALVTGPSAWLTYATQAIFPWYILHQTITVVAGYNLARYSLGPVIEPLLVLSLTVLGCVVLYEFVIRRIGFLRPLFGLPALSRG